MSELLPVGTYVRVTPLPITGQLPYTALVRGYDMGHTKYELGTEYMRGHFMDGGRWAFPVEVEAVHVEATDA